MSIKLICSGLTAFEEVSRVSGEQIRLLRTLCDSASLRETKSCKSCQKTQQGQRQ